MSLSTANIPLPQGLTYRPPSLDHWGAASLAGRALKDPAALTLEDVRSLAGSYLNHVEHDAARHERDQRGAFGLLSSLLSGKRSGL